MQWPASAARAAGPCGLREALLNGGGFVDSTRLVRWVTSPSASASSAALSASRAGKREACRQRGHRARFNRFLGTGSSVRCQAAAIDMPAREPTAVAARPSSGPVAYGWCGASAAPGRALPRDRHRPATKISPWSGRPDVRRWLRGCPRRRERRSSDVPVRASAWTSSAWLFPSVTSRTSRAFDRAVSPASARPISVPPSGPFSRRTIALRLWPSRVDPDEAEVVAELPDLDDIRHADLLATVLQATHDRRMLGALCVPAEHCFLHRAG